MALVFVAGVVVLYLIKPTPSNQTYVIINDMRVSVEIADNFETRAKGLMFRDSLPENHGMIFVFETEGNYPFWMMNMKFNLDIIWIDSKGEVAHVAKDVVPCGISCSVIDPQTNAKYVLEVKAGFVDKYGIRKGSFVEIFLP